MKLEEITTHPLPGTHYGFIHVESERQINGNIARVGFSVSATAPENPPHCIIDCHGNGQNENALRQKNAATHLKSPHAGDLLVIQPNGLSTETRVDEWGEVELGHSWKSRWYETDDAGPVELLPDESVHTAYLWAQQNFPEGMTYSAQGMSMGGGQATWLALRYPKVFRTCVACATGLGESFSEAILTETSRADFDPGEIGPILMVVGDQDFYESGKSVVEALEDDIAYLKSVGVDVTFVVAPGIGHSYTDLWEWDRANSNLIEGWHLKGKAIE